MKTIVALVRDLIFASKIAEVARAMGAEVRFAASDGELIEKIRADRPFLAALDLDDGELRPLDVLRELGSEKPTVIGFYSHVDENLAVEARRAGCDYVVPRSSFAKKLVELASR